MKITLPVIFFYFITLACGLMLPSDGGHGLLSPKSLSFLGLITTILLTIPWLKRIPLKLLAFGLTSLALLFIWLIIGTFSNPFNFHASIGQFKLFVITLFFVLSTLYLTSENILKSTTILRSIIYLNLTASTVKLVLFTLHFMGVIELWQLLDKVGIRYVTMGITGSLSRFQTSLDIITPFLIFFVLQSKSFRLRFSSSFQSIFTIISLLSVLMSFSRLLIFIALISVMLWIFSMEFHRMLKVGMIGAALFLVALPKLTTMPIVTAIIEKRLTSADNSASDEIRGRQIEALLDGHEGSPLFGKGLGSSAKDYLRDETVIFSYEVQWVAFLMQIGLIGLIVFLLPLFFIGTELLTVPIDRVKLSLCGLYGLWLAAGFTNPFLISLTSGIIYSLFILGGNQLRLNKVSKTILNPKNSFSTVYPP